MRLKRSIVAFVVLLAALLLPTLSGCGDGGKNNGNTGGGALPIAKSINAGKSGLYALEYERRDTLLLAAYLSDNMIVQQQKPFNVAGLGKAGAAVKVTLSLTDGETVAESEAKIAADGSFVLTLPAQNASYTRYTLTVASNGETKMVSNLVFGEVYITGGQSNMAYTVIKDGDYDRYLDNAVAAVKLYNIPEWPDEGERGEYPLNPQFYRSAMPWRGANSFSALNESSAVGAAFALELQKRLDIPVGIVNTALGGTVIETWMSRELIDGKCAEDFRENGKYIETDAYNAEGVKRSDQMSAQYNVKIAPLSFMNARGVLWYQGETNLDLGDNTGWYQTALAAHIGGWLDKFNADAFIISQLAPWYRSQQPYFNNVLRTAAAEYPDKCAVVPIYDVPTTYLPNEGTIHPNIKYPIGARMAQVAAEFDGTSVGHVAEFDSLTAVGNKLQVKFKHAGEGLSSADPAHVKGFFVAGSAKKFIEAHAKILSPDTVEVWADGIALPTQAAYAYGPYFVEADLTAKGMPALPFVSTAQSGYSAVDPSPWRYCDAIEAWSIIAGGIGGGIKPLWTATGGTVATDAAHIEGTASIMLIASAATAALTPAVNLPYRLLDLTAYAQLSFYAKGTAAASLRVKLSVGSTVYYSHTATSQISLNGEWTRYTVDLSGAFTKNDAPTVITGVISELSFEFGNISGGTASLDGIMFN
ncbi:MAG: sialate O-acetylesterase [Clostridiales bacterium]|jgi:sialate O-acetylesterase|nr:sialate O-acetylesterase [Clostridiales bacterium]